VGLAIKSLISHPQVLRAAWRRVRDWYAYGDKPPEPDFSRWASDEDGALQDFSARLKAGEVPDLCLPLMPYPKKGAAVRHFCRPSVEVQLYFTAFAVLLAPWLEKSMLPCSFGNRWFRRLYRRTDSRGKSVWQDLPFTLEDRTAYQPYSRAYGMFRRVAHWTSQAMVGEAREHAGSKVSKRVVLPSDFDDDAFPRFVQHDWWNRGPAGRFSAERGYWAEIDLQLAYPSVRIDGLRQNLKVMVEDDPAQSTMREVLDYPEDIAHQVRKSDVRIELVHRLCDALSGVTYNTQDAPGNLWLPDNVDRPPQLADPGLPTGLMISGLLLNAYLNPLDRVMMEWCENGGHGGRGAFLRFADDMRVLARTPERLFEGLDVLWKAITLIGAEAPKISLAGARKRPATLSRPAAHNESNLRINLAKLGPEPVNSIVERYLTAEGWRIDDKLGPMVPPKDRMSSGHEPLSLQDWWKGSCSKDDRVSLEKALQRKALTAGNLNAFVTHLVERMSELGGDGLQERFGDEARQRLTDLHQLVRFEIDDRQVRADTRLSFGTGKLVRAWLPEISAEEDRELIREIRESVGLALCQAPWKTNLWRAVVRAAVRRPCGGCKDSKTDQQEADSWLKHQLELIQHPGRVKEKMSGYSLAWWTLWPESRNDDENGCDRDKARKAQALSAHRAAFWHALRDTITDLDRAISATGDGQGGGELDTPREWAPREWTFRALSEGQLKAVRTWLAQLESWCGILYPSLSSLRCDEWGDAHAERWCSRYEIEALSLVVLRCENPLRILDACDGKALRDRAGAGQDAVNQLSGWAGWVVARTRPADDKLRKCLDRLLSGPHVPLRHWPLHALELMQSVPAGRRAELYVAWNRMRGEHPAGDPIRRLRQMRMQGCFPEEAHTIIRDRAQALLGRLHAIVDDSEPKGADHLWRLREYAWVRRALLGYNDPVVAKNKATRFSLHRLLWGIPWSHQDSGRWEIEPGSVTAMGLPLRIACRLLEHALRGCSGTDGAVVGDSPVWLLSEGAPSLRKWLAEGRRCQFEPEGWELFASLPVPSAGRRSSKASIKSWIRCSKAAGWRDDWEVLPHPLYLHPGVVRSGIEPAAYIRWCHLLQFLTAVRGDEQLLDTLFEWGAGSIPFEERWHWRHHIHMPQVFWKEFERLTRLALGRSHGDGFVSLINGDPDEDALLCELRRINAESPKPLDFRWERVDIQLSEDEPWDMPVAVLPYGRNGAESDWRGLEVHQLRYKSGSGHYKTFPVRIGQVSEHPAWKSFFANGMRLNRDEVQAVMRQIAGVFLHDEGKRKSTGTGKKTDSDEASYRAMVILPEATLPNSERKTILDWARQSRRAVLAGCLWRRLGNAVPAHRAIRSGRAYLSNEALLVLPLMSDRNEDWAPVRQFTLRKPLPAHIEQGLVRALTQKKLHGRSWHMNEGNRWYRFVHGKWGSFTVAICSDLIDPTPWSNLKGEIQHLLTCAYNQDVDLYEAMTWVRAYENFTNVVLVNHGEHGGSFVWTPKHKGHKEVIKLRGSGLNLVADVELPVKELMEAQKDGVEKAILSDQNYWLGNKAEDEKRGFKAPPPGYRFGGRHIS